MTAVGWFAALQSMLVGGVLVWAGVFKLRGRHATALARRSALARLVGTDRAVPAYRAVGSTELVLGAVLLLPPALAAETVLATVLCVGMVGYLVYARVMAPDSPCGCLSDKPTPVRWRALVRATLLAAASGLSILGPSWWGAAVAHRPLPALAVLVAEAAALVALSPELDRHWLLPLRRLRLRWRHPLAASVGLDVPAASTVHQLIRSPAYRAAGPFLRSDILDSWDQDEWRILSYSALYGQRRATAVFAVPRLYYQPAEVKAVLVDEGDLGVLWQFTPSTVVPSSTTIAAEMSL